MIRRQGGSSRETFTVRKVSTASELSDLPVHTPAIEKIEVVSRGRVRRANCYYLRSLRGRATRIRERRQIAPAK